MAFISNVKTSCFLVLICCLIVSLHTSTTEACHRTDRRALLDFKSMITEDPYQLLENWNQSTDCCIKWLGVDCDSNGRVIKVSIIFYDGEYQDSSEFMVGSISPSLGKLKYLRWLELTNLKRLTGTIPPELGKLSHLTNLLLSYNQIKGSVPASFQNLRKLNKLCLNDNLLTGNIPRNVFQHMSSLSIIDLSNNQLSGSIPSTVGFLKNLDYLLLHNNMLTGKLPNTLGNLTSLYLLSARNNRLTGKIPPSLSNLIKLEYLDLSRNNLSGPIPSELVKLNASLHHINLSFNPLSLVNIPSWISQMDIWKLHLARTGLVGDLPEWLSSTSLLDLDLSSNMLDGILPAWIGNITSLVSLNISNNRFHSDIPIELINLYFENLDLHSNNFTGGLASIFTKDHDLNQYSVIDLSYNMFVGRIDNFENLGSMKYLETLVLSNNYLEGSMPESLGKLRSLKTLKLENNGFTGSIPSGVLNLQSLQEFDVSYNKLTGKIPPHTTPFPASSFKGNSGLCDSPLPICKTAQ